MPALVLLCMTGLWGEEENPAVTGPMVGHVGPTEARLWIHCGAGRTVRVFWKPEEEDRESVRQVATPADRNHAGIVELRDLKPDTRYRYRFEIDGRTDRAWTGGFVTPPPPGTEGKFTFAFSSCMKARRYFRQPAWKGLEAQNPAFQILLGDNVYADTTNRKRIWREHLFQRTVPEFAEVLRHVPTYAVWDDHDFGRNNSDGTARGKENSLRAFTEVWANPGYGTEDTPGLFTSWSWGDVDFFLLDGRYHRTPNEAPDDDRKRMLGDAQFAWLAQRLKASTATFKILASGSTLNASKRDGWRLFSFSRKRLFDLIMENRIDGVLYLSGDIHLCRIDRIPPEETGGYPVYDLISSGIANSKKNRGLTEEFMTLTVDTRKTDPAATVKILDKNGEVGEQRTFLLSELTVPE